MFVHSLPSYNYPNVPRHGYSYYPLSLNQSDRYLNALAEARAAEEEIRAQADARREELLRAEAAARHEEELLRRRLYGLQQSRPPQYSTHPFESYYHTSPLRPSEGRLESLRLQVEEEERQLAKLEALRRRRLELEEEERRRKEIEERLVHWGRPAAFKPEVTSDVCSRPRGPSPRPGCSFYPETSFSYGEIAQPSQAKLFVQPPSEKPKYVRFATGQGELPQKSQPAPRKEPSFTSGQTIDLGDFLQQLGLSVPTVGNRPQAPKAPEQAKVPQQAKPTNVQPPKTPEKSSPAREPATSQTSSFPVLDFGQFLNLLANVGQDSQQEQKKQPSPSATQVSRPKSPQATLKEDLEKRLGNEHANEVRDTIQAILESLNPTSTRQSSTATPSTSASKVPASPVSSDKGKTKEVPVATTEPRSLSPKDYNAATERVQAIENRFHALESEFVFPTKLDFVRTSANNTSGPATSHLAYTANNQAVRFYQQSLTYLLTQLDLVESFGNEELRQKRKEVVQKVEHALEDLEQEVEGRWNAKVARESKKRSVTVEDVTSEEEEPDTPKSTSTTHILEEQTRPEAPIPVSTTSIPSAPAPLQTTEEVTIPSLPEQPETRVVTVEPVTIEPSKEVADSVTPTPSQQENFTPETKEPAAVGVKAEEVVETVEETQPQLSRNNSEFVEQLPVEESRIVTPLSAESTGLASPTIYITTTPLDSSEGDLSATIRPSTPIIEDAQQESDRTESLVEEGNMEGSETDTDDEGGFLLQSGEGEEESPKHDFSDVESNASDWSEVDPVSTH